MFFHSLFKGKYVNVIQINICKLGISSAVMLHIDVTKKII